MRNSTIFIKFLRKTLTLQLLMAITAIRDGHYCITYGNFRRFLRIWSHSLKKSFMENFIFCAVWNMMSLYFSNTLNNKFSKTWFYHLLQCVKSVRILSYSGPNFPPSDLIRRDIPDLSAFSPHAGKYGPEKLRIRTLFIKYSLHFFPPLQGLCHLSVTNQFL